MTSKPAKPRTNIQQTVFGIGKDLILFCVHYGIAIVIFLAGIIVMNWPYLQEGRIDPVGKYVLWQSLGLPIVLYSISYMFRRSLGIDPERKAKAEAEHLRNELAEIKRQQAAILAKLDEKKAN